MPKAGGRTSQLANRTVPVVWFIEHLNDYTKQKLQDASKSMAVDEVIGGTQTSEGSSPLLFRMSKPTFVKLEALLRRDPDTEYAMFRQVDGGKIIKQNSKTTDIRSA